MDEVIKSGRGYITFRVTFSAMHELGNPKLSAAENKKIFGKCYKTHGHNYFLEVTVRGPIDVDSGLCCDREAVLSLLENKIAKKYEGQHLNKVFENTSGEDLAREFYQILAPLISDLVVVRLQETPKNFFVYTGLQSSFGSSPETGLGANSPAASKNFSDFRFLMY